MGLPVRLAYAARLVLRVDRRRRNTVSELRGPVQPCVGRAGTQWAPGRFGGAVGAHSAHYWPELVAADGRQRPHACGKVVHPLARSALAGLGAPSVPCGGSALARARVGSPRACWSAPPPSALLPLSMANSQFY